MDFPYQESRSTLQIKSHWGLKRGQSYSTHLTTKKGDVDSQCIILEASSMVQTKKKLTAIPSLKLTFSHLKMHGIRRRSFHFWMCFKGLFLGSKLPVGFLGSFFFPLARRHGSHTEACSDPPDLVIWEADSLVQEWMVQDGGGGGKV